MTRGIRVEEQRARRDDETERVRKRALGRLASLVRRDGCGWGGVHGDGAFSEQLKSKLPPFVADVEPGIDDDDHGANAKARAARAHHREE